MRLQTGVCGNRSEEPFWVGLSARSVWQLPLRLLSARGSSTNLDVVSLASSMMAGLRTMAAIIFVTHPSPNRAAVAFPGPRCGRELSGRMRPR